MTPHASPRHGENGAAGARGSRAAAGLAVLAVAASLAGAAPPSPRDALRGGVVGLAVTFQGWDEDRPWSKTDPGSRRAVGVVVPGPFILTPARMIDDATFIQIEKFGRPTQAPTRVAFSDAEIGLALLAVDDPAFFADLRPVTLADRTPVEGTVQSVRWQDQQLESAASRVKRFRVAEAFLGRLQHAFLEVQTDMQGGGWGEPVFLEDRLVGITVAQERDQRARIVPVEILAAFLARARDPGSYRPFPVFGVKWQVNKDRALAAFLGQSGPPRGVVVRDVPWGSSGCGVIEPRDILLSIDGVEIDAEGFYTHPRLGQILFPHHLVERHAAGDEVPVTLLRAGRLVEATIRLRDNPVALALIPERRGDEPPPYVVAGGLVLRELDADYLRSWGADWLTKAPLPLLTRYYLDQDEQQPGRRRIVILASVLPSEYDIGYQDLRNLVVESVNGMPIDSIQDVAEALARPGDGFHTIAFEPNPTRREAILDAASFEDATAKALETYDIPAAIRLRSAPPPDGGPVCGGTR